MTNAIVGNVPELIATPRMDNVQPKKGSEDFAGSLKKAVEKGDKTEKDAMQKEFASKNSQTDRKEIPESDDSVKKTENVKTDSKVDEKAANVQKKVTDQKDEISVKDDEKIVSETEEVMMTAALDAQMITPLALDSETTELVTESVGQMLEQLGETLEMPSEELSETMKELGFTAADLFVPEKVTEMFAEMAGVEDSISLVMDETLYQTWQDVNETAGNLVENLAKEMGVTKEEVLQSIEEAVQTIETPEVNEAIQMDQTALQTQDVSENAMEFDPEKLEKLGAQASTSVVTRQTGDAKETQNIEVKDNREPMTLFADTEKSVDKVDEETLVVEDANKASSEQLSQAPEKDNNELTKIPSRRRENAEGRVDVQTTGSAENIADFNSQNKVFFNQTENTQAETFETMSRAAQTEEIADQIMEYMKVQMKEDVTELEMQLHPASLGNVHVSLVSREGNITAQFTAQNEAVKAVMETQLVQLKEQFEEQGIKVDAVEVAVSNHQFEKQYSGEEQRESQRNDRSKVRTRRINLEELSEEDLDKLLTDEEMLQADIMKQNGNTVDFTA